MYRSSSVICWRSVVCGIILKCCRALLNLSFVSSPGCSRTIQKTWTYNVKLTVRLNFPRFWWLPLKILTYASRSTIWFFFFQYKAISFQAWIPFSWQQRGTFKPFTPTLNHLTLNHLTFSVSGTDISGTMHQVKCKYASLNYIAKWS